MDNNVWWSDRKAVLSIFSYTFFVNNKSEAEFTSLYCSKLISIFSFNAFITFLISASLITNSLSFLTVPFPRSKVPFVL